MERTIVIACLTLAGILPGYTQELVSVSEPVVTDRAAHSRTWQRTTQFRTPQGKMLSRKTEYMELASGLHTWSNGQWVESKEEVQLLANGFAVAHEGPHEVIFSPSLGDTPAIDILTPAPDDKRLQCRILGLVYRDALTGKDVMIAEPNPNSRARLIPPNVIIWESAFDDVAADVQVRYSKWGLECEVILRRQPPPPSTWNMSAEHTRLEVWTEWFNPPEPRKETAVIKRTEDAAVRQMMADPDITDDLIDFGHMQFVKGKAFNVGQEDADTIPVYKQWVRLGNPVRTFLIEMVEYAAVAPMLEGLPMAAAQPNAGDAQKRLASRKPVSEMLAQAVKRTPTANELARFDRRKAEILRSAKIQVAQPRTLLADAKGVSIDWTLVSSATNFTFRGDVTYYVSGDISLSETTVIEGGTVVKFTNNVSTSPKIVINGPVVCKTQPWHPAIFTAEDDDTVGETITGSTANPSGHYAYRALELNYTGATNELKHLRFRHASRSVVANTGTKLLLKHSQIGYGYRAIEMFYSGGLTLQNILVHNLNNGIGSYSTTRVEHATFHKVGTFWAGWPASSYLFMTNSLLIAVTNNVAFNGSNVVTNQNDAGIFQVVGGGSRYLAANSPYRDTGTTNISASLQDEIKTLTTYPPIVFSNVAISLPTTFTPQSQRDTDVPDLGFHYFPLDFAFGGVDGNTNLTFTAGTSASWFRTSNGWFHAGHGIHMADRQIITFDGRVDAPTYWLRCSSVQEGGAGLWDGGFGPGGITSWADQEAHDVTRAPELRARFTKFALPTGELPFRDDWGYLIVRATDCEFWSGGAAGYVSNFYLTNCFMHRAYGAQMAGYPGNEYHMRNCTWRGGTFQLNRESNPIPVSTRDCAFDDTTFIVADDYTNNPANLDHDYNAFLTTGQRLMPTGANDLLVSSFNWQRGALGDYYLPTNSTLIAAGSLTNAGLRGLYHYTTLPNQVKETNSVLDIGLHFLALNGSNQAIDSDGDGLPDYIEDANGNGTQDSGETAFNTSPGDQDTDGDGVSDYIEYLQGRSPLAHGYSDTNGLVHLRIYTPLK